jgi:hypothetical protein
MHLDSSNRPMYWAGRSRAFLPNRKFHRLVSVNISQSLQALTFSPDDKRLKYSEK